MVRSSSEKPATPQKAAPKKATAEAARVAQILDGLAALYPDAHCELYHWKNPVQLMVAVILSAQCTDERVNMVTEALFARYPDAKAFAASEPAELEAMIRSTGFFHNKAKHIRAACKILVEKYGGEVPKTIDEMIKLPGVARKTANVVLGTAYGLTTGVVVDTHIGRLSRRLGMTKEEDPEKVERDLMAAWPKASWIQTGHQLIWHGRRVCYARKPECETCTLAVLCPSKGSSGSTPVPAAAKAPSAKKAPARDSAAADAKTRAPRKSRA